MRRLFTLAAAIAATFVLVGCDGPKTGADGYRFEEADWVATDLNVRVVLLPSEEALTDAYAEVNGRTLGPNEQLAVFGQVNPNGRCTIYKIDSRVSYAPQWDGHELNHCIYGEFHARQNVDRAQ